MKLARLILRWCGWQLIEPATYPRQSVICVAPHTSNMDFIWGKLYYWAVGQRAHFLMKRELFVPPLGWLFKAMGGIPIDRRHKGNTVEQVVARFRAKDDFAVAITPEGSRKARDRWKTGFYHIAEEAGVPVAVGGLEMLVAQAVYAAEYFLDRKFDDAPAEIRAITAQLRKEQLNVALIGMPSCGKTTIGRALADRLGKRFVDLDEEIVRAAGRSIPDLFAAEGEDGFRAREAEQTARFAREGRQVLSCGGGVVKRPENLRALRQNGVVLFIDRPLDALTVGGGRPLSTSAEALKIMEAQRRPLYLAAADAVIPNETTVADAVAAALEALDAIFVH